MSEKPKKPPKPFTEEQREAHRKLWPDLPGGVKQTPLEEQFQEQFSENRREPIQTR